jgi:hypothetical protein
MFGAFASSRRLARGDLWFQKPGVPQMAREECEAAVRAFVEGLDGRTGMVSAEALWTFTREDVRELETGLSRLGVEARFLCLVPDPAEQLLWSFQQRCNGGLTLSDLASSGDGQLPPVSFARLEAWREIAGPERLIVRGVSGGVIQELGDVLSGLGTVEAGDAVRAAPVADAPDGLLGMTAAKALLALNAWDRGQGGKPPARSATLSKVLRSLKGDRLAVAETLLARAEKSLSREESYLSDTFGVAFEGPATRQGIDDHALVHWTAEEVGQLLSALDRALLALEARPSRGQPAS